MRTNPSVVHEHSRIPLTVVGGPAGTGKTTLIRYLLEHSGERRLAAILPDLRSIDGASIATRDGAFVRLRNGCMCVICNEECAPVLAALAQRDDPPEHVLVEGSGCVDPRRLGGYGYMPGYRPDGTIAVVDAATVVAASRAMDHGLYEQVRAAEVVVLNKLDLAGEREAATAQSCLEWLSPSARVIWSDHARIAPPLLLGVPNTPDSLDGRAILAEWTEQYSPIRAQASSATRGGRSQHGERCRSWCLVSAAPLESRSFRSWVQRLPAAILRGGGVVHLREEPQHRYTFHLFGAHWRLQRGAPWNGDTPATRLLLAGLGGSWRAARRRPIVPPPVTRTLETSGGVQ